MSFVNRVRFEAVINSDNNFIALDLDARIKDIVGLISQDFPNAHISASMNLSHEVFEKNVDIKGLTPSNNGEQIKFGINRFSDTLESTMEFSIGQVPNLSDMISNLNIAPNKIDTQPAVTATSQAITDLTGLQSQLEQDDLISEPIIEPLADEIPTEDTKELSLLNYPEVAIIDALSRIKDINEWMDKSRSITEQIPKIRHELKDLTRNLLDILGNNKKNK